MTKAYYGIRVIIFHIQNPHVNIFGMGIISDLSVRVSNPCKDSNILVVVKKILLPNLNGHVILVQGLVAVGKPEQGIIVAWMMYQAALIVLYCVFKPALLANCVAYADKGIVVVFIKSQDLFK